MCNDLNSNSLRVRLIACGMTVMTFMLSWNAHSQTPKGMSLHVGLNKVNSEHYGSPLALRGCVNDAIDLAAIVRQSDGFEGPKLLLDEQATVANVEQAIKDAASRLNAGDTFVFTIAAHGSQLPDRDGDEKLLDSRDRLDETWLLYDRMWVDDERYTLWKLFKRGVRILVIADTCHAGTSIRRPLRGGGASLLSPTSQGTGSVCLPGSSVFMNGYEFLSQAMVDVMDFSFDGEGMLIRAQELSNDDVFLSRFEGIDNRMRLNEIGVDVPKTRGGFELGINTRALGEMTNPVRTISREDALSVYERNHGVYTSVNAVPGTPNEIAATVILLAACQDFQVAADGAENGAFTGTLLDVYSSAFSGTYSAFLDAIKKRMYQAYFDQIPNYLRLGTLEAAFETSNGKPFALR